MTVEAMRRRFTTEDYHRMLEAGILTADDRVELIEGEIVQMSPMGHRHAACVRRLNHLFSSRLAGRVLVDVQLPLDLDERSEPQPDLALLQPRTDFYAGRPPTPGDTLLVVEVSDATLAHDRGVKVPLYARAGVPEVWLVDLTTDSIEVYRRPTRAGYLDRDRVGRGEELAPEAFPELTLAVDEIIG